VTLFYSDNAKVKAILKAKELIRDASPEITYTDIKKGLKVEFLNDSQKVESTLTAINARIYDIEGNVIVRDSVKLINKKGEILKTEELVWNQKLDKFYTDKKVFIETTPGQVMHGDGLEANADFSWYKINNLKGVITVDNNLNP
jgi:LPS export ABC transporter protein LptC